MIADQQKKFQTLGRTGGRTIHHEGKEYLFFGGTAYLGLNTHPEAMRLYIEGLQKYGLNVGTSRNNNVQLGIYPQAEKYWADSFGFEAGIVVSSGFLATQLATRVLANDADILYAPGAHPALWLHSASPVPSIAFEEWVAQTVDHINTSQEQVFVIASDTLASIRPGRYDFSPFGAIDDAKEVYFILDHSHGFGVYDNTSVTDLRQLKRRNFHFILVGSLAKGLGVDAGVILGDSEIIRLFRQSPVYAGASPPSPAAMHLLIHGETLCREQLTKLQKRMKWFEENILTRYRSVSGFPVYCFEQPDLYGRLVDHGIVISSFAYPTPDDPLLHRVVINSGHTQEDIDYLVQVIDESF